MYQAISEVYGASARARWFLSAAAVGADRNASQTIRESKFELFVTDVEESTRFYTALGFAIAHQQPGGYTTLACGSTVVALSPVPGWLPLRWLGFLRHPPLGTEIVFYSDRLDELHSELEEAGYDPGDIALQPWGDRDFRVTDYDGYYIRVSEGQATPRSP
jgi:lactoylglutathione lyase